MRKVLAIIPAEEIQGIKKNIQLVNKPLIYYTIKEAKKSANIKFNSILRG